MRPIAVMLVGLHLVLAGPGPIASGPPRTGQVLPLTGQRPTSCVSTLGLHHPRLGACVLSCALSPALCTTCCQGQGAGATKAPAGGSPTTTVITTSVTNPTTSTSSSTPDYEYLEYKALKAASECIAKCVKFSASEVKLIIRSPTATGADDLSKQLASVPGNGGTKESWKTILDSGRPQSILRACEASLSSC